MADTVAPNIASGGRLINLARRFFKQKRRPDLRPHADAIVWPDQVTTNFVVRLKDVFLKHAHDHKMMKRILPPHELKKAITAFQQLLLNESRSAVVDVAAPGAVIDANANGQNNNNNNYGAPPPNRPATAAAQQDVLMADIVSPGEQSLADPMDLGDAASNMNMPEPAADFNSGNGAAAQARATAMSQPRVTVVGDIHGQLHDIVRLLEVAGLPEPGVHTLVFNGDYVDRGNWGIEVFVLLAALKMLHPSCVYMLRGNHETSSTIVVYGFHAEVVAKYGPHAKSLRNLFVSAFRCMPIAAVIAGTTFSCHGGLFLSHDSPRDFSPNNEAQLILGTINELRRVTTPCDEDPAFCTVEDVLWSDPCAEEGLYGNIMRGCGLLWGPDLTETFLIENNLKLIIRSHEGPDARKNVGRTNLTTLVQGHAIDHVTPTGRLVTVFSAPDYPQHQPADRRSGNLGAVVVLTGPSWSEPQFLTFDAAPRPNVRAFFDNESCVDSDAERVTG